MGQKYYLRKDEVPSVSPSQLHNAVRSQLGAAVADSEKSSEHMKYVEKPSHDEQFIHEYYEVLIAFSQNVVNVLDEKAQQADFIDQCWQVVVQKESPFHEKVRHEVHQVPEEQREANVFEFPPFLVAQINDLSTTP